MIKAQHLTKQFRKQVAVDDLSFEVATGKVTGFLGPNGAGKSTTMRLMLGLNSGHGETTFDGKRLHDYARPSQVVGILLDAKAFHPTRSARNHLRMLADAGNIPKSRVNEVLELVGLQKVAKKGPGKFSLGMSQRLGIAAALLGNPKYLMLDEPANGLDPEGIAWLRAFLKDYADAGNAVFVSSHLLSEMSQMADNVVVIGKGKLIADTSMEKLLSHNEASSIFVRASNMPALAKTLQAHNITFTKEGPGMRITKGTTDQVGKLAFSAGITVLELAKHNASLEEVFLQLTASSEEYRGGTGKGGKK
jgi:ABC-2 type transport system ATP-binding protein